MPYICRLPGQSMLNELVDDGHGNFDGECVSLLKRLCPALPATPHWKRGVLAKGAKTIVSGTAIATFDSSGKYYGHAAIYVSQSATGLLVWDQYNHPPKGVGKRTLQFNDKKSIVNNGNDFYVID